MMGSTLFKPQKVIVKIGDQEIVGFAKEIKFEDNGRIAEWPEITFDQPAPAPVKAGNVDIKSYTISQEGIVISGTLRADDLEVMTRPPPNPEGPPLTRASARSAFDDLRRIQENYLRSFPDQFLQTPFSAMSADDLIDSIGLTIGELRQMNGRERQEQAVREEQSRQERARENRIMRTIRMPESRIPGVFLPNMNIATVGEPPPSGEVRVRVYPDGTRVVEEDPRVKEEQERRKAEAKAAHEARIEQEKKLEEERKKSAYQPGMPIAEYVARQISIEKDADRLKWLRTFQNCVLPEEVRDTIEEALTTVLMSKKFSEWGVDEAFEKGLTNSILLYGPPGTGKTMIAESFAAVLNKDLLMISNADIQSQIPGQAERNISKNFELAEKEDAVLMFDECDSLLYDRNAVGMIMASEINHLLTCIERFQGVCILTTNRLERLDPALQRRIIAKVELGLPNEEARLQIWQNLVPKKVPVADDVDFSMLAKLNFSGGEIKNVILTAIRKAVAKNAEKVTADHFAFACRSVLKSKKDFEDGRPRVIPHQDVTREFARDLVKDVRNRTIEKVGS